MPESTNTLSVDDCLQKVRDAVTAGKMTDTVTENIQAWLTGRDMPSMFRRLLSTWRAKNGKSSMTLFGR